jgi:hypothetical protein
MKFPRIDASIVCFVLVVVAAVPVATLRSRTYSLGYELGKLKTSERQQRQHNIELKSSIAKTQRAIRDTYLRRGTVRKPAQETLALPEQERIFKRSKKP